MSEPKQELLSSLIDGQLDTLAVGDVLEELESDDQLRGAWSRYHLIGYALRGEPVRADFEGIAERVSQRLAEEVVTPIRSKVPRGRSAWLGPAVGYALAASAALVAVFALPSLFEDRRGPGNQLVLRDLPQAKHYLQDVGTRWSQGQPALDSKLNSYLVNHQEYTPVASMKGLLPYATFVSYEGRR